jgi:hypothetical protein
MAFVLSDEGERSPQNLEGGRRLTTAHGRIELSFRDACETDAGGWPFDDIS